MSGKVSGAVWELDIPHGHAWVLMSLADHAEHDGSQVFPGNGLTAWKTGYSVSQIKRIIRDLVHEYGLLECVTKGGGSTRAEYRIRLENFDRHKKAPMASPGRPKDAEKNRGHGDPSLSDPPRVGSSTRAHDDRTVSKEPSRRDARQAEASQEVNYFQVFSDAAKLLNYTVTAEDRKDLPGNLKTLRDSGRHDDEFMRQVVRRCLIARSERQYPLSPQRARDELLGNVTELDARRENRRKKEPKITYDEDGTMYVNGVEEA